MSAFDKMIVKKVQSLLEITPKYITLSESINLGYCIDEDYYQIRYGYFDRCDVTAPNDSNVSISRFDYFETHCHDVSEKREMDIAIQLVTPSRRTYTVHTDFATMDSLVDKIYEVANNAVLKELEV